FTVKRCRRGAWASMEWVAGSIVVVMPGFLLVTHGLHKHYSTASAKSGIIRAELCVLHKGSGWENGESCDHTAARKTLSHRGHRPATDGDRRGRLYSDAVYAAAGQDSGGGEGRAQAGQSHERPCRTLQPQPDAGRHGAQP